MLSLEQCRKHLSETEPEISDEKLIELRRQIYDLSELILEDYFEKKMKSNPSIPNEGTNLKEH